MCEHQYSMYMFSDKKFYYSVDVITTSLYWESFLFYQFLIDKKLSVKNHRISKSTSFALIAPMNGNISKITNILSFQVCNDPSYWNIPEVAYQ